MQLIDRDSLTSCCALLSGFTWLLAILSIFGLVVVFGEVSTIPGISGDTIAGMSHAAAQSWTSTIASDMIRVFAVGAAAFGMLAVAPAAAGIALIVGRSAIRAGGDGGLLIASLISAACYLLGAISLAMGLLP